MINDSVLLCLSLLFNYFAFFDVVLRFDYKGAFNSEPGANMGA